MCHDRPDKKPLVVDLPIRLKGNSKRFVESFESQEQGYCHCFAVVTNCG